MPSTKEIRRRIKSVKNTAQITKAMQLVSAAKMRKAQESALGGKAYSLLMGDILNHLAHVLNPEINPLLEKREVNKIGVLLITTNRGLVGALNTNLLREAGTVRADANFITLGKKGRDFVARSSKPLLADFELPEKVEYSLARTLSKIVTNSFLSKEFDEIFLLYSDFINTLNQKPKLVRLLPIEKEELVSQTEITSNDYLFEPQADQFLAALLPHFVEMKIYQSILEAAASEHSARMVAMKNATDNAKDLVEDLNLAYNQLRQNKITTELLDITSSSMSME